MTPRRLGAPRACPRYTPTFAGASQVSRVRSGLISVQLWPPFVVFQRTFDAKKSVRLSSGENSSGAVRSTRKFGSRGGVTSCAWPGAPIVARQLAAVDDVGIVRIRRDVAVFFGADRDASRAS